MENISQLVANSLARNGVATSLNHLHLQWSRWFRCESSFSVLLAPAKPGIFALAEEIIPPSSNPEEQSPGNSLATKRMLALFQINETDDLGMALGRLFLPGNPLRERLTEGRCLARYTVIEDADERAAANAIFNRWLQQSVETASDTLPRNLQGPRDQQEPCGSDIPVRPKQQPSPSTSSAWDMGPMEANVVQAPIREATEVIRRPTPFPSGF